MRVKEVEVFAYKASTTLGLMEATATTAIAMPFLWLEIDGIGAVVEMPPKAVALPPKGRVPTPENVPRLLLWQVSTSESQEREG